MKKKKATKLLYSSCNICILLISLIGFIYTGINLVLSINHAKNIFAKVNNEYEACFGIKYLHSDSYFTDLTCMKMEISTDTITKSSELKEEYLRSSQNTNSVTILRNSLSEIQVYNKEIEYKDSIFSLTDSCNSLYTALNYMTYGSNALLLDIINFSDDPEMLSLIADKDTQQIHVMANMSANLVINLNTQITLYTYLFFISLLIFLGTGVNIYRLKKRTKGFKRRRL